MQIPDSTRRWLVAGACFAALGVAIGSSQYAFGVFLDPLNAELGWSRTQISASLSFLAVGSLLAPLVGRVMDRHGARPVLVGSLLCMSVSYLLRPLMSELWHWYALSFLQFAAFAGATSLPTGRLIGVWFWSTRGRMMGLTMTGPNAGGLLVPPLTAAVIVYGSWRYGYVFFGLACLAVALFALVVVRERPDGRETPRSRGDSRATDTPEGPPEWTVAEAVRTRTFWAITVATMIGFFTYATVLPHVVPHLIEQGASVQQASFALGALATCGLLGKLVFGMLAERITARRALVVDLAGHAVFLLFVAHAGAGPTMWPMVAAYGFFLGGIGVLTQVAVQEAFGVRYYGSIAGLTNLATVVSYFVGPLLAGASFDLTGSYTTSFVIVAVLFAGGAVVLMVVPDNTSRTARG